MTSKLIRSIAIALTLMNAAGCRKSPPDPQPEPHGAVSVAWSITVAGQLITCARVGAAQVSLVLHSRAGSDSTFSFACAANHGAATRIIAGPYDATLRLHASDGALITTATSPAPVIVNADEVTTIPPVTFTTGVRGRLALSIATLGTDSNCTDRGHGGAGTTGNIITLIRADGGCSPATFIRSRGNTKLGEYTVNCSSPQIGTCIEQDETLTTDLDAGPYTLQVLPLVGPARCSIEIDVMSVPAGATLTKRVQLVPAGLGC